MTNFAKHYHSEQCNIPDVAGQSEQLVICKKCGSSEMYQNEMKRKQIIIAHLHGRRHS